MRRCADGGYYADLIYFSGVGVIIKPTERGYALLKVSALDAMATIPMYLPKSNKSLNKTKTAYRTTSSLNSGNTIVLF